MDQRLEEWALYRIGGRSVPVATYSRLRYGTKPEQVDQPQNDAAIETGQLLAMLPPNERTFIALMYPRQTVRTLMVAQALGLDVDGEKKLTPEAVQKRLGAMLARVQLELARMLAQRRSGEPIDPCRPLKRLRPRITKINGRRSAATSEGT